MVVRGQSSAAATRRDDERILDHWHHWIKYYTLYNNTIIAVHDSNNTNTNTHHPPSNKNKKVAARAAPARSPIAYMPDVVRSAPHASTSQAHRLRDTQHRHRGDTADTAARHTLKQTSTPAQPQQQQNTRN